MPLGRHLRSIRSHTSRFTNIQTHQTLSTQPTPSSLHIYTPPLPTHLTNLSHGLSNLIIQAIHTKPLVLCTTSKHFATCCLSCAFLVLCIFLLIVCISPVCYSFLPAYYLYFILAQLHTQFCCTLTMTIKGYSIVFILFYNNATIWYLPYKYCSAMVSLISLLQVERTMSRYTVGSYTDRQKLWWAVSVLFDCWSCLLRTDLSMIFHKTWSERRAALQQVRLSWTVGIDHFSCTCLLSWNIV